MFSLAAWIVVAFFMARRFLASIYDVASLTWPDEEDDYIFVRAQREVPRVKFKPYYTQRN